MQHQAIIVIKYSYITSELVAKITLQVSKMKSGEFAKSVDPDEVAHNEPPHHDLCYLPS